MDKPQEGYRLDPEKGVISYILPAPTIRPEVQQRIEGDNFHGVDVYKIPVAQVDSQTLTKDGCWKVIQHLRAMPSPEIQFGNIYQVGPPQHRNAQTQPAAALVVSIESEAIVDQVDAVRQRTNIDIPPPIPHMTIAVRRGNRQPWRDRSLPSDPVWETLKQREAYAIDWQDKPETRFPSQVDGP